MVALQLKGLTVSNKSKKNGTKPVDTAVAKPATKPVEAPVEMRAVVAATDGTLTHILQQTCSNLELWQIGQRLVETAQQRERAAIQAMNEAKGAAKPKTDA